MPYVQTIVHVHTVWLCSLSGRFFSAYSAMLNTEHRLVVCVIALRRGHYHYYSELPKKGMLMFWEAGTVQSSLQTHFDKQFWIDFRICSERISKMSPDFGVNRAYTCKIFYPQLARPPVVSASGLRYHTSDVVWQLRTTKVHTSLFIRAV